MVKSRVITAVSVAAIAGSLLALFLNFGAYPPGTDATVPREVGRALAEAATRLLPPGGRITVLARDTSAFRQPAAGATLDALLGEIRKAGATLASVEILQVDPLRPLQVSPDDFFQLLRRAKAGDVIVSLMGPPLLSDEQRQALGEIKPQIVAFCPGNLPNYIDLRLLAERHLLHAAVLARPLPSKAAPPLAETFDNLYVRASAAELAKLPSP